MNDRIDASAARNGHTFGVVLQERTPDGKAARNKCLAVSVLSTSHFSRGSHSDLSNFEAAKLSCRLEYCAFSLSCSADSRYLSMAIPTLPRESTTSRASLSARSRRHITTGTRTARRATSSEPAAPTAPMALSSDHAQGSPVSRKTAGRTCGGGSVAAFLLPPNTAAPPGAFRNVSDRPATQFTVTHTSCLIGRCHLESRTQRIGPLCHRATFSWHLRHHLPEALVNREAGCVRP